MIVNGFAFAGIHCGLKAGERPDLALIVADRPASCAGVFTTNRVVAAPVVQSRALLPGRAQVVVVNSGNANACTGAAGAAAAARTAEIAAEVVGCAPSLVQVASTGVIGAPLPIGRLESGIPLAAEAAAPDGLDRFARAIMTTDTRPKVRVAQGPWTIAGACKGAGMIHPNMATMLAFLVTDAAISPGDLDRIWRAVCDRSFNAITIDGDTSTNDTALLLASGDGPPLQGDDLAAFAALLEPVARELATDIVRDAEGGTKTIELTISGAADQPDARAAAQAVALSPLVKTALFGEDPNWGRIVAAAGRSGAIFEPGAVRLWIGDTLLYDRGVWQGAGAERAAHETMTDAEYAIRLDLGAGEAMRTIYTCDLSPEYVRINADYRS